MKTLRIVLITLALQGAVLLGLSYLGALHPAGDSIAIFRLQIAAVIFLLGLMIFFAGARLAALLALLVSGTGAVPIIIGFAGGGQVQPGAMVLYQKNLLQKKASRTVLTGDILAANPTFITFQEISEHDLKYMKTLFDAYEHIYMCPKNAVSQTGVLSRLPIIKGSETCLKDARLAAVQVVRPDGSPLWIASVHLSWPFPAAQHQQAEKVIAWLNTLRAPVLIGGDFNMVPWGSSVSAIARAAHAQRLGPYRETFPVRLPLMSLPIDHILLPENATGTTEVRPLAGSDHFGVIARFDLQ